MAFETLADLSTDNAIALGGFNKKERKANPTSITGYYIGSKQVASPKSKTGFAALHVFQTPEGNVGVWGKTDLDQKLRSAQLGAYTRVTFTGMQETKNNPMYKYKVEIDRENTIEVAAPTNEPTYAADDVGDGFEDLDEYTADDAAPARAPANPASTPTADQQARVQALLNKRK